MRCHFPTLVLTKSGSKGPDLRLSQHKAPLVDNLLFNYPSSVAQDPAKDNKKRCSTIEKNQQSKSFKEISSLIFVVVHMKVFTYKKTSEKAVDRLQIVV